jgi:menaquinone-specific isochorismate synthase
MAVLITTEVLGEISVLTSVENQSELTAAWIRSGDGLIGFGEYKRIEISGSDRFKQARTWWNSQLSDFKIQNNVHGSGTGPVLFTSFSFDSDEKSVLIIPEIILGRKNGKSWVTWIGQGRQPDFSKVGNAQASGEISWAIESRRLDIDEISLRKKCALQSLMELDMGLFCAEEICPTCRPLAS